MSASGGGAGGWLVRLDRAGRPGARLELPRGRITLGRHLDCDVRVLQPGVQPLHADVLVHANQTIIRNLSEEGSTLVNGQAVSVAALRHDDVITIGDRQLRWQYAAPRRAPHAPPQPALVVKRGGAGGGARRVSAPAAWRLALRLPHRASAPGNTGGKQVAIVQPQRRDTNEQNTAESSKEANKTSRGRASRGRSAGKPAASPATPARAPRSPAPSPVAPPSPALASAGAQSPTRRQSRPSTAPLVDVSASKRASHASPAKRQSTRINEPSPAKRQSTRSNQPSPAKRQSTRSNEPAPASIRQSTRSDEPSPAKRQSTRRNEPSPAKSQPSRSNEPSPDKRQSIRSSEPTPASKRQSVRSNEPSSASKRESTRSNEPSPAKRQSTRSNEPSPASTKTSPNKRISRASLVSPASQRQSIRSNASSPAMASTSVSKRSSGATLASPANVSPKRVSTRSSMDSSKRQSAQSSESDGSSSSERQSKSPKRKSRNTASSLLPSASTPANRRSMTATPEGRQSRTLTPVSALSSPAAGRASSRISSRVSLRTPAKATPVRVSPKTEPRLRTVGVAATKSTPLRLAVLRRAQSAAKARGRVTKIQAPTTVDHTKQAALLLMAGRAGAGSGSPAAARAAAGDAPSGQIVIVHTSLLNQPDSPLAATPRKSALKDPSAKKSIRKTDSIKFDLSNLDSYRDSDVVVLGDSARDVLRDSESGDDITLHYSDTSSKESPSPSPSPRRSIHSRSSRMLEQSGATIDDSLLSRSTSRSTVATASPKSKSLRGSVILQKSLRSPENTVETSRRSSRTATDVSWDTTTASAFRSRTMSPRNPNLESYYSVVDLISADDSKSSVYDSVGSTRSSSILFGSPCGSSRHTRFTIDPTSLTSSTPFVKLNRTRSNSSPNISTKASTDKARRSKSLTTPENTQKHISMNSTRISRASRSKSRINESDLLYISSRVDDIESPRSSRKSRKTKSLTLNTSLSTSQEGTVTPENARSPEEAGTPVLSIQSLLDSSQSSLASQRSTKRGRPSKNLKRKTIGALRPGTKGRRSVKSKSLIVLGGKSPRSRISPAHSDETDENAPRPASDDVTPKSAVKLVPEAVKNKHSTAKKPQSKRSIIDNINDSDVIKKLFNSPVKRKLSQSMTEYSRRQLFDEDVPTKRPTRNTIALTGHTPDNSLLNQSEALTPELFVSPLSLPGNSPNLSGVKRLFRKSTPKNDLTDVKGVKSLLRTPRERKSVRNDLTRVSGVKAVFAKSPKNRLSDVRVKEIFAEGPKNELTRLSGVRSLFQVKRNDLTDVRGVKKLFTRKSVANDLTNVSGVKKVMRANTPRNDLRDVRGVRKMFQQKRKSASQCDVSGIEELFDESTGSRAERNMFDDLLDKPQSKAVYSKSYSATRAPRSKGRRAKSLLSVSATDDVEQWIQEELKTRVKKSPVSKARKSLNKTPAFKSNVTRELQKLAIDAVGGSEPVLQARVRNSTLSKTRDHSRRQKSASEVYEARTLPIKKRSIAEASLVKSAAKAAALPIKKRAVVHSTPVKGAHSTMNASELGRVSPIVSLDATATALADPLSGTRSRQQKASPKRKANPSPKSKAKGPALTEDAILQIRTPASPKPRGRKGKVTQAIASPKPTRGRRRGQTTVEITTKSPKSPEKAPTPKSKKNTRAKTVSENVDVIEVPKTRRTRNNTEKQASVEESPKPKGRRAAKPASPAKKSPAKKVIAKKSPVKRSQANKSPVKKSPVTKQTAPAPKKTRAKANVTPKSPSAAKPTRSTRNNSQKPDTNTKKRRSSLVITKKPPVLSPKPAARGRKASIKSPVEQATAKKVMSTRRQRTQTEVKPKTPRNTRAKGTKTSVVIAKPSPVIKPRATQEKAQDRSSAKGRSTRNTKKVQSPKKSPKLQTPTKPKKGRTTTEKSVEVETKKGRKTANKSDVEEVPVKRGRKTANESKFTAVAAKRGRKVAEKPIIEPKTKKNKSSEKLEEPPVKKGRKPAARSANTSEIQTNVTSEPMKKTRGVRGANKTAQEPNSKAKAAVNKSVDAAPTRATRKTKVEDKVEAAPPVTRKRKNVEEQSSVPAKLKKTDKAGGKKTASPAAGRPARGQRVEESEPARGKTRAAPAAASTKSPGGRAATVARRRR